MLSLMKVKKEVSMSKNYYYQNDEKWKDLVMIYASEMHQKIDKTDDTIGEWGCNVISSLNIYNDLFSTKKMNPVKFVEFIRKNKFLNALYSQCKDSEASNFRDFEFWQIMGCSYLAVDNSNWFRLKNNKNTRYKICVKDSNSGSGFHFMNFMQVIDNNDILVYNVYNDREENVNFKNIYSIRQITKI